MSVRHCPYCNKPLPDKPSTCPYCARTLRSQSPLRYWPIVAILLALFAVGAFTTTGVYALLELAQATPSATFTVIPQPSPSQSAANVIDTETPRPGDTRVPEATATFRPTNPPTIGTRQIEPISQPTATQRPRATVTATLIVDYREPTGHIVYTCFINNVDNICRLDVTQREPQRLTRTELTDFYASPGPEGKRIVFSSRRSGSFQIYNMNADGSNVRLVSPLQNVYAPHISPDGSRIVFTYAYGDQQDIWVMDSQGQNAQALTNTSAEEVDPVWAPDGRQIAFASDRNGEWHHYVMNADGGNVTMLPADVENIGGRSDWSPDGRWLAFHAGPDDGRDIYMVSTDGSGTVIRLTDGGRNLAPSFSPDGAWITFLSYRDGDGEIHIMRPDGSDVRQLTFNSWTDWQPRWGP